MGHAARTRPKQFRRAVAGSVATHLLLAVAVVVWVRSGGSTSPRAGQPSLDTRANEITVRLPSVEVTLPAAEPSKPDQLPTPAEATGGARPPLAEEAARPPLASVVPNALPNEVLALIRRPAAFTDPNARPAGGVAAAPIHGVMKPGQTVVYVLDCSGSMGEFGKLDAARAALVATLRRQPGEVRFQVIAYNSTARALLPGGCVAASGANITATETALVGLTAAGRSNHAEAVRAAGVLRPDVIVLLTDAGGLTAAQFRPAVAVWVARVGADGVAQPRELK